MRRSRAAATAFVALVVAGCATVPEAPPRMAASPLGCMRATVAAKVPAGFGDKHRHCLAAGMIARHCSLAEARIASWGKEFADAIGPGHAEREDLAANAVGIACARDARDEATLQRCCAARYPEPSSLSPSAADPAAQP